MWTGVVSVSVTVRTQTLTCSYGQFVANEEKEEGIIFFFEQIKVMLVYENCVYPQRLTVANLFKDTVTYVYGCVLMVWIIKVKVLPKAFCSTSLPQNIPFSSISWFSISNNPNPQGAPLWGVVGHTRSVFLHMNADFGIIFPVVGFVSTISSGPCWYSVKTSVDGSGFSVSTYLEKSWCGALMQPLIETEYLSSASRCRWVNITVWWFAQHAKDDDDISCMSSSKANPSSAFSPGTYTRIQYVIMSITLNCDPSRILQWTRGC